VLDVFGTGGSSQYVGLTLPCANWSVIGDPADAKGYKYTDAHQLAGPCTSISVKNRKIGNTVVPGQLKAVCSGKAIANPLEYDLDNGEGSVGVTFRMGAGLGYCAAFGGTIKKDDANSFQAQDATPPGTCPTQSRTRTERSRWWGRVVRDPPLPAARQRRVSSPRRCSTRRRRSARTVRCAG
jgi:hypothetical protein